MPGSTKMLSSTTVPPTSTDTCSPSRVRTGMNAFLQRVAQHDRALGQALGGGGAHEVLAQHFEHLRAGQPHQRAGEASPRMIAGMITCARFFTGSSSRRV